MIITCVKKYIQCTCLVQNVQNDIINTVFNYNERCIFVMKVK